MPAKTMRRTAAIAMAGLLVSLTTLPVSALAGDAPSAGTQTGTGATDVTVRVLGSEAGGTSEPKVISAPADTPANQRVDASGNPDPNGEYILNPLYNPDANNDGLGDNIAFTVPASINFVAAADGTLTGPDATVTFIENASSFAIHASAFRTATANGWTIVDKDAASVSAANAIDFQFGPAADVLDAYDYTTKSAVHTAGAWNMAAKASSGTADRVGMGTSGHIHNVSDNIVTQRKVAEIHTYVTPGTAS